MSKHQYNKHQLSNSEALKTTLSYNPSHNRALTKFTMNNTENYNHRNHHNPHNHHSNYNHHNYYNYHNHYYNPNNYYNPHTYYNPHIDVSMYKISKMSVFNNASLRRDRLKIPRYQNTYQLEAYRPFCVEAVDKIIRDLMETKLSVITSYDPDETSKLCLEIAGDVLKAIEKKDYDRYKLVTQVYIIQRFQQNIHAAFQCLWDKDRDNYSFYVFENNHIHAWCCVFGIYYE